MMFRHDVWRIGHSFSVLTLAVLAIGTLAAATPLFGRASRYVQAFFYSSTMLIHMITGSAETLTRLPPGAPLVTAANAFIFKDIISGLCLAFLIGLAIPVALDTKAIQRRHTPITAGAHSGTSSRPLPLLQGASAGQPPQGCCPFFWMAAPALPCIGRAKTPHSAACPHCRTRFPRTPAMRKLLLALIAALSLSGCGYNDFQRQDEGVKAAWSEVLNNYQRRADLIPNLVATVQGAADFEKSTLVELTNARASVGCDQGDAGAGQRSRRPSPNSRRRSRR